LAKTGQAADSFASHFAEHFVNDEENLKEFLKVEEGIEGLVHVSEISKEKVKTPVGKFNIGDPINARVMTINSDERRIGLSIKRIEMEREQGILSDYVSSMGQSPTTTFGELLRENLQEKLKEE